MGYYDENDRILKYLINYYFHLDGDGDDDMSFKGVTDVVHVLFFVLLVIFILENIALVAIHIRKRGQVKYMESSVANAST